MSAPAPWVQFLASLPVCVLIGWAVGHFGTKRYIRRWHEQTDRP